MRYSIILIAFLASVPFQTQAAKKTIQECLDEYGFDIANSSHEFTVSALEIFATIMVESDCDPSAIHNSDAQGLTGMMPGTLEYIKNMYPNKYFRDNLFVGKNAIRAAAAYRSLCGSPRGAGLDTANERSACYYIGINGARRREFEELYHHWYSNRVAEIVPNPLVPVLIR